MVETYSPIFGKSTGDAGGGEEISKSLFTSLDFYRRIISPKL